MSSKDFKFGNQGGVRKKALTGLRQFVENDILIRLVFILFRTRQSYLAHKCTKRHLSDSKGFIYTYKQI